MSRGAGASTQPLTGGSPTRSAWSWRRLLLIGACLALGLAAGLAYYTQTPKTYQASATVLVLPTATGLDPSSPGGSSEINMETEAELARSASVASEASDALDGRLSTTAFLADGNVSVPENSQVVQLTVLAPSPELARDAANAWADAYLVRRSEQASDVLSLATQRLEAQLDTANAALDRLGSSSGDQQIEARREIQITKISDIERQLIALGVGATDSGQVITEATLPAKAAAPQLPLSIGAGLFVGAALAVGLLLIGAARRAQAAPKEVPTVEREVRVLGSISTSTPEASSDELDELRGTCREIANFSASPGPVALVAGTDPATATRVTMCLGDAWSAEFGAGLVVSTDSIARDTLPVEVKDRPGVFDLINGSASPSDCAAWLPNTRAVVIGPGSRAQRSTEVNSHRLMQIWSELDKEFGTVLVSSIQYRSPIGAATLRTAGRIVGIVHADERRDLDLAALMDTLDEQAASDRLVGVLLVDDGELRTTHEAAAPASDSRATGETDPVADQFPTQLGSRT